MSVVRERHGAVLLLRIDRPEARNALDAEVIEALAAGVVEAEADPEIRAVVLTGKGDKAFCAGVDLKALAADSCLASQAGNGIGVARGKSIQRGYGLSSYCA